MVEVRTLVAFNSSWDHLPSKMVTPIHSDEFSQIYENNKYGIVHFVF